MHRRLLLTAWLPLLPWIGTALAQNPPSPEAAPAAPPRLNVPLDVLQSEVGKRFPLRYPVAGLVNLDLAVPHLGLLPASNRLRAEMAVNAAGPILQRSQPGTFTVDFSLRYEHSDRTLRAHQLKVYRMRFPGLPADAAELLNTYAPALAEQSLREVVLYQLNAQETAMADLLGLRPGRITVTGQGLGVELVTKPL
ncbi:DUF1439 domain-containing protein [Hydrogenophaga sp.]|jgi:hypothetical protein|uniref:DUF1439 domain-containing protein n=1 Tax=Hydrogenophaga sp. TaxID=1904254 RepID=UPI002733BE60|nr:DUF1439 domain-containing protein [Hydrogenophaga sp.]MDP3888053.1 DUF1439 domain-containing protein [Hydrogenophaga sp.]MDZ4358878.1 DUF1439 domain-containing protein [Variovorax sp.]